jgi:arylformamidase
MASVIDISLTITNSLPVWPGDPGISLTRVVSMDAGATVNVSRLDAGVHTGTHIDAPLHFLADGAAVPELDLTRFIGPCQVVELAGTGPISAAELVAAGADAERLLLKTSNSALWEQPELRFDTTFRALALDAAEWLVARGVRLIGIDYLSIEPYEGAPGAPVHITLLRHEIAIVEGLRLGHVAPGRYQLVCLPLKLAGSDGAPARAVLLPLE